MEEDSSSDVQRSAITGKKLKLKVKKSSTDKVREANRGDLLKFLNAAFE